MNKVSFFGFDFGSDSQHELIFCSWSDSIFFWERELVCCPWSDLMCFFGGGGGSVFP